MIRGFWRLLAGASCLGLVVLLGLPTFASRDNVIMLPGPGGMSVPAVEGELLVKFRSGTIETRQRDVHRAASATVVKTLAQIGVSLVQLPEGTSVEEAVAAYRARPEVLFAEPNYIHKLALTPNDTYYAQLDHLPLIKSADAWDMATGSDEVVIAVIDTGVMLNHPDLQANVWVNRAEVPNNGVDDDSNGFIDDVNGWDFIQNDKDPNPRDTTTAGAGAQSSPQQFEQIEIMDHGTHVAGLAAAVGNNGVGVTGVCWKASIMALRIFDEEGGGATVERVSQALLYAADNGAKVANMSFGGYGVSETVREAVNRALGKDVVLVAAAGNDNLDLDITPIYPCGFEGVIGVASTNKDDTKSNFSNYGSRDVDISAPGGNSNPVWALLSTAYYDPDDEDFGDPYALAQGTSMASPVAAGLAGLIRALNPDLTRAGAEAALVSGADNIDGANPSYVGKLGSGRVNAVQSLVLARPAPKIQILFPTESAVSYSVTPTVIGLVKRLSARAPAVDPNSVVISVDGTQKFSSATDSGFDANTGELQVVLPALAQGQHTLKVEASDVAQNRADPVSVAFRAETYLLGSGPQMFSVPYLLTRTDPATVLGESSPRLFRYEPGVIPYHEWQPGTADPFVASVSPGKAYWVQNAQETPLRVEGGTVAFRNFTFKEEYQGTEDDPLRPGWHQIGTPFPFATSAGSLLFESGNVRLPAGQAVAAGWVARTLYWYTSRGYDWSSLEDGIMQPFVGYWIRTLVPCRIIMPPVGTRGSRSAEPAGGRGLQGGWQAGLTIEAGRYVDAANIFGVAPVGSEGRDIWDVEKPPTPGVSAGFVRGEGLYARELLSEAGETKSWDLAVRTALEDETVSIAWEDLRSVPRDVTLVFTDLATNKRVLMRTSGGYTYETGPEGGERRFRITAQKVGAGLRLGLVGVQRVRGGGASVSVSVARPALVTVEILGLSGGLLRRVVEREAVAGGAATFYWDGRDEQGTLVPAGSYLCEVRAETEEGERVSAVTSFVLVP